MIPRSMQPLNVPLPSEVRYERRYTPTRWRPDPDRTKVATAWPAVRRHARQPSRLPDPTDGDDHLLCPVAWDGCHVGGGDVDGQTSVLACTPDVWARMASHRHAKRRPHDHDLIGVWPKCHLSYAAGTVGTDEAQVGLRQGAGQITDEVPRTVSGNVPRVVRLRITATLSILIIKPPPAWGWTYHSSAQQNAAIDKWTTRSGNRKSFKRAVRDTLTPAERLASDTWAHLMAEGIGVGWTSKIGHGDSEADAEREPYWIPDCPTFDSDEPLKPDARRARETNARFHYMATAHGREHPCSKLTMLKPPRRTPMLTASGTHPEPRETVAFDLAVLEARAKSLAKVFSREHRKSQHRPPSEPDSGPAWDANLPEPSSQGPLTNAAGCPTALYYARRGLHVDKRTTARRETRDTRLTEALPLFDVTGSGTVIAAGTEAIPGLVRELRVPVYRYKWVAVKFNSNQSPWKLRSKLRFRSVASTSRVTGAIPLIERDSQGCLDDGQRVLVVCRPKKKDTQEVEGDYFGHGAFAGTGLHPKKRKPHRDIDYLKDDLRGVLSGTDADYGGLFQGPPLWRAWQESVLAWDVWRYVLEHGRSGPTTVRVLMSLEIWGKTYTANASVPPRDVPRYIDAWMRLDGLRAIGARPPRWLVFGFLHEFGDVFGPGKFTSARLASRFKVPKGTIRSALRQYREKFYEWESRRRGHMCPKD